MLIPQKLKHNFLLLGEKTSTNTLVHGQIMCCSDSQFDVFYYGKLKKFLFNRMTIDEAKDEFIVVLRCKKCGKELELFNNLTDGYDRCIENKAYNYNVCFDQLFCGKNAHANFSVFITLEYPSEQELIEDKVLEYGNAFSWIWISLKCNKCKKQYKNIVSYETG